MNKDKASGQDSLESELVQLLKASTRRLGKGIEITPDEAVVARLNQIINEIGWPTKSKVGPVAATAFAELAKSVRAIETKRRWSALIRQQPAGDVDPIYIAQFEDGLRVLEGQPQLYGSMYQFDDNGEYVPIPIEDPDGVDARRASIGLVPLTESLDQMRKLNAAPPPYN